MPRNGTVCRKGKWVNVKMMHQGQKSLQRVGMEEESQSQGINPSSPQTTLCSGVVLY